jgi:hypothetical protein
MPIWCNNFVEVKGPRAELERLKTAFEEGKFCNAVIPVPQELMDTISGFHGDPEEQAKLEAQTRANIEKYGHGNWYDFCTARWGTKWDVGGSDGTVDITDDGTMLTASFESAWAPPIGVYEAMVEQGLEVRAYYYEGGMCFAGIWEDGVDNFYSEWGDSQGAKNTLPQDLDELFGISESQAEWEEEERREEELYAFVKDGVEQRKEIKVDVSEE